MTLGGMGGRRIHHSFTKTAPYRERLIEDGPQAGIVDSKSWPPMNAQKPQNRSAVTATAFGIAEKHHLPRLRSVPASYSERRLDGQLYFTAVANSAISME